MDTSISSAKVQDDFTPNHLEDGGAFMNQDEITKSLAELREQGRWIVQSLHELKVDVNNLNAFKWKVIGAAGLALAVIEIARAKG